MGSSNRVITRPVVDFPHPDSPTSPSVSPGRIEKDTPSTALTAPTCRWNRMPCLIGKYFWTRFTLSSACGSSAAGWTSDWDAFEVSAVRSVVSAVPSVIVGGCPSSGAWWLIR